MIVTAAYVQGFGHAARAKLVDARAARFYSGPSEPGMSGGHIPGAVSVPFTTMADDSMVFYSPAELEQKFRAVGVQPGDTVVGYCHVGQQATMMLFGAELTGHPVRLYDGSMQDWTARKLPTVGAQ
jgi:thiosulfate/3-mercaptopyruvate sulfurtransferase